MISEQFISSVTLERDKVPSWKEFPFSLNAVCHLDTLNLHKDVTFFVGENGSGKSTLLEGIAVAWGFNPEGGSRHFQFETRASHSDLHRYLRLSKGIKRPRDGYFLRAESFFNVATQIEKIDEEPASAPRISGAYSNRALHEQSHGESFLALLTNRFFGNGLYILDEPEAALSPSRQMAVLSRIHDLVQDGSQFIIATHSPIIMAYPNATIYQLSDEGINAVDYSDTEHFIISKNFLNNHHKMLDVLMKQSSP
ncbi:MAG: AAA family ATPase [bacterium]|nr:AAA family ATPase [bacterium]